MADEAVSDAVLVGISAPPNPAPLMIGSKPRSPQWPQCQKFHLTLEPKCRACGATKNLNVHHKKPYHKFPELELDQKNLITLCETPTHNCHFILGHLMNWEDYNEDVEALVELFAKCLANRKS